MQNELFTSREYPNIKENNVNKQDFGSLSFSPLHEMLKVFPPDLAPINLLRWDDKLDYEDGSGVRIALLDSGINWSEHAFTQAHIRGRDFTGSGSLFDPTGHGTGNAALLVGHNTVRSTGIIPGCELLVAKVLGPSNWKRTVRAVTKGIRWAVQLDSNIIILPFGTSRGASSIAHEIRIAVKKGCRVFAAAGNRGKDQIYFPARLPEVTAVSALARDGTVYPGCCARDVDLYVRGESVPVSGLNQIDELSGSSPATVIAGGFTALQRAMRNREKL